MSNPMTPPPGGNPADAMRSQRSWLNGTDVAAEMGENPMDPQNTTVRELLERMGIQVDGPAIQLIQWQQKQMQNKNPATKGPPQGAPPAPTGRPPMAATGPFVIDVDIDAEESSPLLSRFESLIKQGSSKDVVGRET